jgi:hypothetical protein
VISTGRYEAIYISISLSAPSAAVKKFLGGVSELRQFNGAYIKFISEDFDSPSSDSNYKNAEAFCSSSFNSEGFLKVPPPGPQLIEEIGLIYETIYLGIIIYKFDLLT